LNSEIYIDNADLQRAIKDIKYYGEKVQEGLRDEIERVSWAVSNAAKKNCPVGKNLNKFGSKEGRLKASIHPDIKREKFEAKVGTNIGYGAYVEFGTPPHIIRVKNKKVLAFPIGRGGWSSENSLMGSITYGKTKSGKIKVAQRFIILGKQVNHPGTKAKPFLFPAAESERPKFIQRIKKILSGNTINNG
jgi:hypothetical protein